MKFFDGFNENSFSEYLSILFYDLNYLACKEMDKGLPEKNERYLAYLDGAIHALQTIDKFVATGCKSMSFFKDINKEKFFLQN